MQHAEKYIGHCGSQSIKYEAILKKTSYKKDDWGRGLYSVRFSYIGKKWPFALVSYDFAVQVDIWCATKHMKRTALFRYKTVLTT